MRKSLKVGQPQIGQIEQMMLECGKAFNHEAHEGHEACVMVGKWK